MNVLFTDDENTRFLLELSGGTEPFPSGAACPAGLDPKTVCLLAKGRGVRARRS